MMKKIIFLIMVLLLSNLVSSVCDYEINNRWTEGAIIKVYNYGKDENSRFFMPNIIKIYNGCNKDIPIHELAHYDRQEYNHNVFFWLSYYRIKGEIYET